MFVPQIRAAALAIVAGLSLSACASFDDGYGSYSSVSFGIGSGGYYDPYYDDYYRGSRYGRGYEPYYGWNRGFYYPGTGYYVYDQYRRPHRWNDHQRRYWEDRRRGYRGEVRDNWREFRQERRVDNRRYRQERRDDFRDFRRGEVSRDQFRQDRRMDRREYRRDLRQDRRELRRENRRDRRD